MQKKTKKHLKFLLLLLLLFLFSINMYLVLPKTNIKVAKPNWDEFKDDTLKILIRLISKHSHIKNLFKQRLDVIAFSVV